MVIKQGQNYLDVLFFSFSFFSFQKVIEHIMLISFFCQSFVFYLLVLSFSSVGELQRFSTLTRETPKSLKRIFLPWSTVRCFCFSCACFSNNWLPVSQRLCMFLKHPWWVVSFHFLYFINFFCWWSLMGSVPV